MALPNSRRKSLAAAAALAVATAIALHLATPTVNAAKTHGSVTTATFLASTATHRCTSGHILASDTLMAKFGVASPRDAGSEYVRFRQCYDDTSDAGAALPPGWNSVGDTEDDQPWQAGQAETEYWVQGDPTDPSPCACAADATCLWNGSPGPKNLTFQPGTWAGAGCVRKTCIEFAGASSMPAGCQ